MRAEPRAVAEHPVPVENRVTPGPTDSTTPANSLPRTVARGRKSPVSARMKKGWPAPFAGCFFQLLPRPRCRCLPW